MIKTDLDWPDVLQFGTREIGNNSWTAKTFLEVRTLVVADFDFRYGEHVNLTRTNLILDLIKRSLAKACLGLADEL